MLNNYSIKIILGIVVYLLASGIALNMIILSNTVTHYIGCDNKTTQECIKSITGGN